MRPFDTAVIAATGAQAAPEELAAILYAVAAVLVLIATAVASAWEAALYRVTRLRITQLEEDGVELTPFERWTANPKRYVRTLLVLSTLFYVLFVVDLVQFLRVIRPEWSTAAQLTAAGGASFLLLLVLGKVLPRNWGRAYSDALVPVAVRWLDRLAFLLAPGLFLLDRGVILVLRLLRVEPTPEIVGVTEEEVKLFLETSEKEGVLEEDERDMLVSVFEFGATLVKEIMTPRTEFVGIDSEAGFKEVYETVIESGHSRFPVYTGGLDQIDGLLYAKDLHCWHHNHPDGVGFELKTIARPAIYVPENKNVSDLLRQLRQEKTHMAIVVDEYGGTAGLVTIEDILEEIVGEIVDEHDEEDDLYVVDKDGSILVDARIEIERLADDLDINLGPVDDEYDYETLGGFLCAHLGSVPAKGQQSLHNGYRMTVEDADERKVKRVRIERLPADDAPQPHAPD